MLDKLLAQLPDIGIKVLEVVLAVVLGVLVIRLGRRIIAKVVESRGGKRARTYAQTRTIGSLISSLFDYTMYFIIAAVVLGLCGVNVASLVAVAGVGGVAIGFGAQTLVKDVIGGVFLWLEGSITVGDVITIGEYSGEVESIALRTTILRNVNGNRIVIPNGDIRTVVNQSWTFKVALVDVRCPYDVAREKLHAVLEDEMAKAAGNIDGLAGTPEVMGIVDFQRDCMLYRIAATCAVKENWRIEREIRNRVKDRFDREGIVMPHYVPPTESAP